MFPTSITEGDLQFCF